MTIKCFSCRQWATSYIRLYCLDNQCLGGGKKARRRHRLCLPCFERFKKADLVTMIDVNDQRPVESGKSLPIAWKAAKCPTMEHLTALRLMGDSGPSGG